MKDQSRYLKLFGFLGNGTLVALREEVNPKLVNFSDRDKKNEVDNTCTGLLSCKTKFCRQAKTS